MQLIPFRTSSHKSHNIDLHTDRMIMRRPVIDNFEEWRALRDLSANFLRPWEPKWTDDELHKTTFKARLRNQESQVNSGRGLFWFLFSREENRLVGGISLSNVRRGIADTGTLGYWTGQPYAGQGYMKEAVNEVCEHAFGHEKLHRVEASTMLDNERSQRLLYSCGFEKIGMAPGYLKIDGQWRDHFLFSRLQNR